MSAFNCSLASLVTADERKVSGFYFTPDSLVPFLEFKCMMKITKRNKVVRYVSAAVGHRVHVMDVKL
jgi:hypothetical protein